MGIPPFYRAGEVRRSGAELSSMEAWSKGSGRGKPGGAISQWPWLARWRCVDTRGFPGHWPGQIASALERLCWARALGSCGAVWSHPDAGWPRRLVPVK